MTWQQLIAWQEYFSLEPWGEERADLRIAQLTALTANINRDSTRRPTPFTAMDFMPFAEKPKLDQAAAWAGWKAGIKALGASGEPRKRRRAVRKPN